MQESSGVSALKGERVSWQLLFASRGDLWIPAKVRVEGPEGGEIQLRNVGCVPSLLPARSEQSDPFYLRTAPGVFPDVLEPLKGDAVELKRGIVQSIFVTASIPETMPAGDWPVSVSFETDQEILTKTFMIRVLDAILPPQELTYTQWFHADCIASFYGQEVFSEEHWQMVEKFVEMAAHTGINMILTPIFTPPLDTEVGRERPTTQLVDVTYRDGAYTFGFDKLKHWIEMCRRYGIEKFEMAHLFTQWGTGCTPKIVALTENGLQKLFGWHVRADSEAYRHFLGSFLPALTAFLKAEGAYENTVFHISDEPNWAKDFALYQAEREMLEGLVPGDKIIDAISHAEFCECGLVKRPVVVTYAVDDFIRRGYRDIWAYTCCVPGDRGVSNRFIAMPSGRNRIMGFQLYKYGIGGFLHWGYNFYYTRLSRRKVNPFAETDAGADFPSGDAFSVYPGPDGPIESLRSMVFYEGLQDLRACRLLERYIGREAVTAILEESGTITFNEYPRTDAGVAAIRERINTKLEEVLSLS